MARSILVAVDNPIQAEHVRVLLEGAGYLVHMAANGREGLQSAQSAPPDLIISDVGLPEVDGYAFCRAVKSDEATKRIPFVLLTKRKSPIDIIHGLEIGADNFITKPFDDEYLLERVRRIFEHLEFRQKGFLEVEVTVHVAGHDICITADKQQIIELLFASFEELERVNARLVESQRIVGRHAEELEAEVEQRTRRLRETEEKYRTLVEHLPVATYTAALDGMIGTLYISPQIEAMLGFSQGEWLADRQLWSRQMHPQDRERVLAEWAKAIAGGAAFYAEYRIHARNGEVVWLRDQAVMALDDTGQPRFMHGFLQDITSRRRAEEALRESEDRYRDLVEHSQDLVCTHDLDGRILSVNPWAAKTLGYAPSDMLKMNIRDVIAPEVRREVDQYVAAIRRDGVARGLMLIQTRAGEKRIWEYANTLRTEGVPAPIVRGMAHDITERKQAERSLKHSRALLQSFVEHTPAAVAMFDKELRYVAVSRRWLHDYRLGDQNLIGRHHYDIFPEIRGLKEWQEVHQRCLAGAVERRAEERFVRQDGTEDWLRWEVRPWYDISGEVGGIIMFTEVITERKREEATREALYRASLAIQEPLDLQQRLDRLLQTARTVLELDRINILLADPEGQWLQAVASLGTEDPLEAIRVPIGPEGGGLAQAYRTQQMVSWQGRGPVPEALRLRAPYDRIEAFRSQVFANVPLVVEGQAIGVLGADRKHSRRPLDSSTLNLLQLFGAQAAVAIQNARLFERVRAKREQLQALSQRLVEVQEAERRHIARELHDEIGQVLTGLQLVLEMGTRVTTAADRRGIGEAKALVHELISRVRELSLDLRPAMLDDLGLVPALLWHIERYTAQTKVKVTFEHAGLETRFSPEAETAAYRIVQEALTNVARHAAVNRVTVILGVTQDMLCLQIQDTGVGFDPQAALVSETSSGLAGMRERATLLGGRLVVESVPGAGTRVTAELPLSDTLERRANAR